MPYKCGGVMNLAIHPERLPSTVFILIAWVDTGPWKNSTSNSFLLQHKWIWVVSSSSCR